jgi:hypothetical protein
MKENADCKILVWILFSNHSIFWKLKAFVSVENGVPFVLKSLLSFVSVFYEYYFFYNWKAGKALIFENIIK